MGNYSLNFALSNFEATYEGLNVTAESFTVTANTQTINNVTTGYLIIDLQNVHAEITQYEQPISLTVGQATLNVDLYLEGGYMEYRFYADTTNSIYEIAENAFENFT
jgi:stress response protein SCP2